VRALQASGYSPDQIDDIYITHLHEDHAGGLLKDGKPVFAKAIVHVSQTDFDFWTNDANKSSVKPLLQPFFPAIQKVLKPYVDMGRVRPFEPSATFAPGFRAITRPGHTPGHSFYLLEDAGQAILFWGDTVHMAAVQFPEPDIAIEYDWNVPDAIAVRQQILAEAADKGWLIAGSSRFRGSAMSRGCRTPAINGCRSTTRSTDDPIASRRLSGTGRLAFRFAVLARPDARAPRQAACCRSLRHSMGVVPMARRKSRVRWA
jgi:glyoxylase-like metal-dependent hydrolase (beta-lactamase superfamily II)